MSDPNAGLTWANLEDRLQKIWGLTPQQAAEKRQEIREACTALPRIETFHGFKRFLRGAGWSTGQWNPKTQRHGDWAKAYSGGWWFEEKLLPRIEAELGRIPLPEDLRKSAVVGRLRAALAVAMDWNDFSEIWALEIPAGKQLTGLVSHASVQPIHSGLKQVPGWESIPRWCLRGGEWQVFFMVKDPTWVRRYQ